MVGDIILKQDEKWLKFTDLRRVIVTEKLDEVRKYLLNVEDLVNEKGWTAVGFLSYEAAPAFDSALSVVQPKGFPLLWFGLYENSEEIQAESLFSLTDKLPALYWEPDTEKEFYNNAIERIKKQIEQGKTYQVNYTMRLRTVFNADPRSLFAHLALGQNKYAAYLDIGDWVICSASHELFFELDGETIRGRPMKGTVKRGRTTSEDDKISAWLRASAKNRAENVMIVDMIRNDIGRIAQTGSVHVPELFTLEQYPTLFQLTSTIEAKTNASIVQIFDALFPCASITGAPKVSTMKIISELETSPRNIYCGSIGYIAPHRKSRFNVAIRTALVNKQTQSAEYGIGGGIVWDSTSTDEHSEALLKAQVLTNPPAQEFSLFETLLWTPDDGFFLLDRHIARIMDSAKYFGFPSDEKEDEFRHALKTAVINAASPKRVKILLNKLGKISTEVKDFSFTSKMFRACLAKEAINSNDLFLFHKTTNRGAYEQKAIPGFDDTLLFNENGELTEFTIGNLVAEIGEEYYTPPVQCGLLAGTFRAELIEDGRIKERVIKIEELKKCSHVFLINSLRKWVEIKIEKQPVG